MSESMLDVALRLNALGLSVIPIPRPDDRHDGKRPAIAWAPYQQRRATEEEIREWFSTPQNIGIVCGAVSGIVAVDLDTEDAREAWIRARRPYSPWQVRTARGWHIYYAHPGTRVPNAARLAGAAIDIRADGGFVVGPGSVHASGAVYTLAGDWTAPRHALARFWPGWLARPEPRQAPTPRSMVRPSGDVAERARRYLASIPRPEIGQGSDGATLYAACRLVRGFALDTATAADLLWEWAGGRPGWTYDWVRRKVECATRYGTEPVGGLLA